MQAYMGLIIILSLACFGIVALIVDIIRDPRIERCKECHQWVVNTQRYFVDDEGDIKHEVCKWPPINYPR